jgi:hypothetical protein
VFAFFLQVGDWSFFHIGDLLSSRSHHANQSGTEREDRKSGEKKSGMEVE